MEISNGAARSATASKERAVGFENVGQSTTQQFVPNEFKAAGFKAVCKWLLVGKSEIYFPASYCASGIAVCIVDAEAYNFVGHEAMSQRNSGYPCVHCRSWVASENIFCGQCGRNASEIENARPATPASQEVRNVITAGSLHSGNTPPAAAAAAVSPDVLVHREVRRCFASYRTNEAVSATPTTSFVPGAPLPPRGLHGARQQASCSAKAQTKSLKRRSVSRGRGRPAQPQFYKILKILRCKDEEDYLPQDCVSTWVYLNSDDNEYLVREKIQIQINDYYPGIGHDEFKFVSLKGAGKNTKVEDWGSEHQSGAFTAELMKVLYAQHRAITVQLTKVIPDDWKEEGETETNDDEKRDQNNGEIAGSSGGGTDPNDMENENERQNVDDLQLIESDRLFAQILADEQLGKYG